jgi:hypothetical protein
MILADVLLNFDNDFTGTLSQMLAAGRYQIGLSTDSPFDPAFTIAFATPVAGVPEPASWAMMIFGFGILGIKLRRQERLRFTLS